MTDSSFSAYGQPVHGLGPGYRTLSVPGMEGQAPDCRIICHKRVYMTHKNIICSRSTVFDQVVKDWRDESQLPTIHTSYNPGIVGLLIQYLYFHDYEFEQKKTGKNATGQKKINGEPDLTKPLGRDRTNLPPSTHALVYIVAERAGVSSLMKWAKAKLQKQVHDIYRKNEAMANSQFLKELNALPGDQGCDFQLRFDSTMCDGLVFAAQEAFAANITDEFGLRQLLVESLAEDRVVHVSPQFRKLHRKSPLFKAIWDEVEDQYWHTHPNGGPHGILRKMGGPEKSVLTRLKRTAEGGEYADGEPSAKRRRTKSGLSV